jgi:hypothetical protein
VADQEKYPDTHDSRTNQPDGIATDDLTDGVPLSAEGVTQPTEDD